VTSQEIWARIFAQAWCELDPHRIGPTLAQVFRDFRDQHPDALRLSSHNLLVLCAGAEQSLGLAGDLDDLLSHYPGRAVVVVLEGPPQAPIQGAYRIFSRKHQLAGELIGLQAGDGAPLPSLLAPVWQDGLPLVTIWRGPVPYAQGWFRSLVENSTRFVIDSGVGEGAELAERVASVRGLWSLMRDPYLGSQTFSDMTWGRLAVWRDWLASLFDRPEHRALLPRVELVELEGWATPGEVLPGLPALYLAAWLSVQLGWGAGGALRAAPGGYEGRCGSVVFKFYPRVTEDPDFSGRTVRVSFRGQCQGQPFRLSVERDSNDSSTLVVGASGPGCGGGGHRLHMERQQNLSLLGHELEMEGRDRVFEKVLERLLEIAGVLEQEVRS
jgi:hypothetical protein